MLNQSNTEQRGEFGWLALPYVIAMVIAGTLAMVAGMIGTDSWLESALFAFAAAVLVGGTLFTVLEMRRCCS